MEKTSNTPFFRRTFTETQSDDVCEGDGRLERLPNVLINNCMAGRQLKDELGAPFVDTLVDLGLYEI